MANLDILIKDNELQELYLFKEKESTRYIYHMAFTTDVIDSVNYWLKYRSTNEEVKEMYEDVTLLNKAIINAYNDVMAYRYIDTHLYTLDGVIKGSIYFTTAYLFEEKITFQLEKVKDNQYILNVTHNTVEIEPPTDEE